MNEPPPSHTNNQKITNPEIVPIAPEPPASGRVSIGTLNVFLSAHQKVKRHLSQRYHRHYHPRHRFGPLHLSADILLAATVLGLILYNGYLYGFSPRSASTLPITFTITTAPRPIATGGTSTIKIEYQYTGDDPLTNFAVDVDLPSSFELERAEPTQGFEGKRVRWSLGEISPGTMGELKLTGTFWAPNEQSEAWAIAASADQKNNGQRQQIHLERYILQTYGSALLATVSLPSTVVLKQRTSAALTLTNTSDQPIKELWVKATPPSQWATQETTPAQQQNEWRIARLEPGGKQTLILTGSYEQLPQSPSFFFRVERARDNTRHEVLIARADTTILDPGFELSARVEGAQRAFNPGETIPMVIRYHHRGEFPIEEVTISAIVSGAYADQTSIRAEGGAVVEEGNAKWTPQRQTALKQIVADQQGQMRLSLKAKETITLTDRSPLEDIGIMLQPQAIFRVPILPNETIQWAGSPAVISINSQLALRTQTRYYSLEGDQIGRGPLPPRVGKTTTYWVTVTFSNTIHDVYETRVEIPLGAAANYTDRSTANVGDLRYDSGTRSFVWTIGRLDHFLGPAPPTMNANIELAVTPTNNDRGREIELLGSATAAGVDAITKSHLTTTSPRAVTTLSADQRGGGKGIVQ